MEEMRGQVQVLAAYAALAIMSFVLLYFFVQVFSATSGRFAHSQQADVLLLIMSRPEWSAAGLGMAIVNATGARYVFVNITTIDVIAGATISIDTFNFTAIGATSPYVRSYAYARETREGYLRLYYVEVGT
ncbi:MAG: hypothetical protein ABWK00_01970 [Desulfurococcaceae archaeon]